MSLSLVCLFLCLFIPCCLFSRRPDFCLLVCSFVCLFVYLHGRPAGQLAGWLAGSVCLPTWLPGCSASQPANLVYVHLFVLFLSSCCLFVRLCPVCLFSQGPCFGLLGRAKFRSEPVSCSKTPPWAGPGRAGRLASQLRPVLAEPGWRLPNKQCCMIPMFAYK